MVNKQTQELKDKEWVVVEWEVPVDGLSGEEEENDLITNNQELQDIVGDENTDPKFAVYRGHGRYDLFCEPEEVGDAERTERMTLGEYEERHNLNFEVCVEDGTPFDIHEKKRYEIRGGGDTGLFFEKWQEIDNESNIHPYCCIGYPSGREEVQEYTRDTEDDRECEGTKLEIEFDNAQIGEPLTSDVEEEVEEYLDEQGIEFDFSSGRVEKKNNSAYGVSRETIYSYFQFYADLTEEQAKHVEELGATVEVCEEKQ